MGEKGGGRGAPPPERNGRNGQNDPKTSQGDAAPSAPCAKPRIAVFYATVGTGHRAAAEALAEWCLAEYPGSKVLCRDLLDYTPRWVRWCVTRAYLFMARRAPWLWGKLYSATDRSVEPAGRAGSNGSERPGWGASFWGWLNRTVSRACLRYLVEEIEIFAPSAILATHFFGMSALLEDWAARRRRTPIYYVGTDYISHAVQRDPRFDGWFVASEDSVRQHEADGLSGSSKARVRDLGIPIARAYASPPSRSEARRRLGVPDSAVSVLIAGGGIGAGALGAAADSLLPFARSEGWRVDILCGSNRKLYEALRGRYRAFEGVTVRRFIHNIIDCYAASDVVILKPGGLSSAEVTACGCAVLLLDPLPGQEQYNCDYLLERGAARRIYEVRGTGEQIAALLKGPDELKALRANAKALGRPGAARAILRAVLSARASMQS